MMKASSELLLLDVNVLFAVAWREHQFHVIARDCLDRRAEPWATCALTQLGFIRLSSNPAATQYAVTPAAAAALLAQMVRDPLHHYINAAPPPSEAPSIFASARGHKQVTDAYLVRLAREHRARFLTLDTRLRDLEGVEVLR